MPDRLVQPPGSVLVLGAGAVGCYLGGSLSAAGVPVTLVGRPRVLAPVSAQGLTMTDLHGARRHVQAAQLTLCEQVPSGAMPALVLLCVKSAATADAARELQERVGSSSLVVSMQNGVSSATVARAAAPGLRIAPGMVPFNIAQVGPAHFHRGTDGTLAAQDDHDLRQWSDWFQRGGLPLGLHADLAPLQWGKLLLNLNNPVNALSGVGLKAELLDRDHRRVLAALIDEALGLLRMAGLVPAAVNRVPPRMLPTLLRLPTLVFRALAASMLRMDERARSSMADDLARGVPTEINALCGEIVRLADRVGGRAPANQRMVALIEHYAGQPMSGEALRAAIGA